MGENILLSGLSYIVVYRSQGAVAVGDAGRPVERFIFIVASHVSIISNKHGCTRASVVYQSGGQAGTESSGAILTAAKYGMRASKYAMAVGKNDRGCGSRVFAPVIFSLDLMSALRARADNRSIIMLMRNKRSLYI